MKLTNSQILSLAQAINALDGRDSIQVVDGKAISLRLVPRLTAAARWSLARNAGRLQLAVADYERARGALINQHGPGGGKIAPTDPGFNAFAENVHQLNNQSVEVALDMVPLADLRLEENETAGAPIPIAVLNTLAPLIDG